MSTAVRLGVRSSASIKSAASDRSPHPPCPRQASCATARARRCFCTRHCPTLALFATTFSSPIRYTDTNRGRLVCRRSSATLVSIASRPQVLEPQDVAAAFELRSQGVHIALMVDHPGHVAMLGAQWGQLAARASSGVVCSRRVDRKKQRRRMKTQSRSFPQFLRLFCPLHTQSPSLELCLDVDMSWRPLGGLLHLGAHRCVQWTDLTAARD